VNWPCDRQRDCDSCYKGHVRNLCAVELLWSSWHWLTEYTETLRLFQPLEFSHFIFRAQVPLEVRGWWRLAAPYRGQQTVLLQNAWQCWRWLWATVDDIWWMVAEHRRWSNAINIVLAGWYYGHIKPTDDHCRRHNSDVVQFTPICPCWFSTDSRLTTIEWRNCDVADMLRQAREFRLFTLPDLNVDKTDVASQLRFRRVVFLGVSCI